MTRFWANVSFHFFSSPPQKNTMTISCPKFAILTTSLHPKTRPFAQWIRLRILWAWKSSSNIGVKFILNPFLSMQITQKIPGDSIRDPEISPSWRPRPAIERVTKNHPKKVTKTWSPPACRVVLGTPQFSLEVAWLPQKKKHPNIYPLTDTKTKKNNPNPWNGGGRWVHASWRAPGTPNKLVTS